MKMFFKTLFVKQNEYHKYSVLGHTLAVANECIKAKKYKLIPAAILHDIGKPVVAHQDEDDIGKDTYSFTGHEEKSYQIIKKWPISERTKLIVRHHYLITGMAVDERKFEKTNDQKFLNSYNDRFKIWSELDAEMQKELMLFKMFDDLGKGYPNLRKAVPKFLEEEYSIFEIQTYNTKIHN